MRVSDVELYSSGRLEPLTVVTSAPQTNPGWFIRNLSQRFVGSKTIELGVEKPRFTEPYDDQVLIISNAELPVLAGLCTADELVKDLQLLATNNRVIVCLTLSESLVDKNYETGKQLARLAVRLLYEANLLVQLHPLKTGRARDITGRFIVARGPKSRASDLIENDLFYFVGLRGSVELRTRE